MKDTNERLYCPAVSLPCRCVMAVFIRQSGREGIFYGWDILEDRKEGIAAHLFGRGFAKTLRV